ncbi:MAG: aspartate--tRNA ligase [Chloroflexi bacterium RBG_13_53_26]|nr:MAG: aspartate--tRNA ligase [Chloroflexi bacterium RBG_13_53_26]
MLRTHSSSDLTIESIGQTVTLAGWVHRRRDHGGLIFIDLRDRDGLIQVVFDPRVSAGGHGIADTLRNEYVVQVSGEIGRRPSGTENPKLATGQIELAGKSCRVLNTSKTPPFYINEDVEVDESLRLEYRYLDLRRQRMKENIILRHQVMKCLRDYLNARGFLEIETPILIKSTPEGARDFLVPSRLQSGKFYALPQSPQQLKQLLMVAGFEKYYQLARCFRDEDLRADRQPEFTQLDLEMSFVEQEDILILMEDMFTCLVETVKPSMRLLKPFPRLSYDEVMARYGTDKPDVRFGLELRDLTDIAAGSQFGVFRSAVQGDGRVKGICAPGCGSYTRSQLDELIGLAKTYGAKGLVALALISDAEGLAVDKASSAAAKFISPEELRGMANRFGARAGDLLLIVADQALTVDKVLDQLRREMGRRLGLIDPTLLAMVFVVDFPLFDWSEDEKRWNPMHHPFTAPKEGDIPLLDTAPGAVKSWAYDVVCNGYEISSGSIRIHSRDLQEKIFRLLGYSQERIELLFGQLLRALEYGAPPHGGIAPGIDRIVMILAGEETIREVIPFPKNQSGCDLLFDAPSDVSEEQLRELHIIVKKER